MKRKCKRFCLLCEIDCLVNRLGDILALDTRVCVHAYTHTSPRRWRRRRSIDRSAHSTRRGMYLTLTLRPGVFLGYYRTALTVDSRGCLLPGALYFMPISSQVALRATSAINLSSIEKCTGVLRVKAQTRLLLLIRSVDDLVQVSRSAVR